MEEILKQVLIDSTLHRGFRKLCILVYALVKCSSTLKQ